MDMREGPHPVGAPPPPIGCDKRVPPVSYFLRVPARSVLTGLRLGAASQRHAPRWRGYIAWPPAGQHGARGGSGTRRLVLRLAHALLHPLESMENDRIIVLAKWTGPSIPALHLGKDRLWRSPVFRAS